MSRVSACVAGFALVALAELPASAATHEEVQARIARDLAAGKPIIAHVVVALCDNEHQGIVPVPKPLGNGQDPGSNLYWGALYGVRTFLPRHGWARLTAAKPADVRILERSVFFTEVTRAGVSAPLYVVADAWDGAHIEAAVSHFLELSAGRASTRVSIARANAKLELAAGGDAQLVAFVGHDGLMDFSLPTPQPGGAAQPRSAIVLACSSQRYFADHLRSAGAHALLLTTGLMAPEAYTLDAALRAWASGGTSAAVDEAAAQAYEKYQSCGIRGARQLFWTDR